MPTSNVPGDYLEKYDVPRHVPYSVVVSFTKNTQSPDRVEEVRRALSVAPVKLIHID